MALSYYISNNGLFKTIHVLKDGTRVYYNTGSDEKSLLENARYELRPSEGSAVDTMSEQPAPPMPSPAQSVAEKASQSNIGASFSSVPKIEVDPETPVNLQSNTSSGFNKITTTINDSISKTQDAINKIYYGKQPDANSKHQNPLDYGLVNVADLLASVDLCAIANYALNQIPGAKKFDPKDKSETNTPLGKIKYNIQYSAYKIQTYIDAYYTSNGGPDTPLSKTALQPLITQLTNALGQIVGPSSDNLLKNPEFKKAFPASSVMDNLFENCLGMFNNYTDLRNIPDAELQRVISFIDKTRDTCIAIQSLTNPADLIALADSFLGGAIAQQIAKLNKLIDPKKIAPVVKQMVDACQKVQSIIDILLNFVNLAATIIELLITLINIFQIVLKFIYALPIPNMVTTIGISTLFADLYAGIKDVLDAFKKRLEEFSAILGNIVNLLQDISFKLQSLIQKFGLVILNLENCENLDPNLAEKTKKATKKLEDTNKKIEQFLSNYNEKKKKSDTTLGDYTISILSEELTDEGIIRKRRYGVALDSSQVEVVKTTPTFASDDNIIINEVKSLLSRKIGIDKDSQLIQSTANFLSSAPSIGASQKTTFDNGFSVNGLNLSGFLNNQRGSTALKNKTKTALKSNKNKLSKSLSGLKK